MFTLNNNSDSKGHTILLLMLLLSAAAFALIQGLLVLYCTKTLHFSDHKTYTLYAAYSSLIFITPVLGGYVAGRLMDYTLAAAIGNLLAIIGIYAICFSSAAHLYIGLGLYCSGMATLVPSLWVLFGSLIKNNLRDTQFTVGYTCMNIGAFIALAYSGFITRHFSYHNAFFLAGTILLVQFFIFIFNIRSFTRLTPHSKSIFNKLLGTLLLLGLALLNAYLLYNTEFNSRALYCIALVALLFILFLTYKFKNKQKKQLRLFVVITTISVAFWALYSLEPSLLTLFVQRNIDHHVMGINIPTPEFLSLNPLFIIILGAIFSVLWARLQKTGKSPSFVTQFSLGISLLGIAYLLLSYSMHNPEVSGRINMGWMVLTYGLFAAAELCIAPIGTARVGLLVPQEFQGAMMGIWQLSIGIGCVVAGYLAQTTITHHGAAQANITDISYGFSFYHFGMIALLIAIIALLVKQLRVK